MQFFQMEEYAGGVDDMEFPIDAFRKSEIEEFDNSGNAGVIGDLRHALAALDAHHIVAEAFVMGQLRAVVRPDVEHTLSRRIAEKAVFHLLCYSGEVIT